MLKRGRKEQPEFYDSAFGLPDFSQPQVESSSAWSEDSSTDLRAERLIAVVATRTELRDQIVAALACCGAVMSGANSLQNAAVVVAELGLIESEAQLVTLRASARPDAALIVILSTSSAEAVRTAHERGAFACIRQPLVAAELQAHVTAALDSKQAQNQVADLTRRLDLEAHLASIGRMSAGLAHEIGNPLQVASANTTVLEESVPELRALIDKLSAGAPSEAGNALFEDIRGAIEGAREGLDKLTAVLTMMRGLVGRERSFARERVALSDVVTDVQRLLDHELEGVEVELITAPVHAMADRTVLGQIVHNLIANAALAAKPLPSPRLRLHVYAAGDQAVISVRDNGPGIPLDLQDRIFEPFYTTRRGRGGTGLGLALCREYALQLGAALSLWSMPGRGACFRLSLPSC